MSQTYDIRTVADFAKIPEDRLDDCLTEFATAIRLQHHLSALMGAVATEISAKAVSIDLIGKCFQWIDDGKRNMQVNILTPPHPNP